MLKKACNGTFKPYQTRRMFMQHILLFLCYCLSQQRLARAVFSAATKMDPTNSDYQVGDALEVWISYSNNGDCANKWQDNLFGVVIDEPKGIYQMVFGIDNTDERQPYPQCKIDVDDFKAAFAVFEPLILSPMTQQVKVTKGVYGYTSIVFNQENGSILGLDELTCLSSQADAGYVSGSESWGQESMTIDQAGFSVTFQYYEGSEDYSGNDLSNYSLLSVLNDRNYNSEEDQSCKMKVEFRYTEEIQFLGTQSTRFNWPSYLYVNQMAFYYQYTPACSQTIIHISDITNIDILINSSAYTFNIEATDNMATNEEDLALCGEKTYTLQTNSQPWIVLTGNEASIQTVDFALAGNQVEVIIRVSFVDHPNVFQDLVVQVSFTHPCEQVTLSEVARQTTSVTYNTYDDEMYILNTSDDLVSINPPIDCGPFTFTWRQQKDVGSTEALDSQIFQVYHPDTLLQITARTENQDDIGSYVIVFEASLTNYPSVTPLISQNPTVGVEIVYSSCGDFTFTGVDLPSLEFYYTEPQVSQLFTESFTSEISDCVIIYSCSIIIEGAPQGDGSCDQNTSTRQMSFDGISGELSLDDTTVEGEPESMTLRITATYDRNPTITATLDYEVNLLPKSAWYSRLQVDNFPQESTTIDLSFRQFDVDFSPPKFKDDSESGIHLLDPSDPQRKIYVKIKDHEDEDLEDFLSIIVVENTSTKATLSFQKAPQCKQETFQLVICYSYGQFPNLQELCDYEQLHSVINSLGECFTDFQVYHDYGKIAALQAQSFILNPQDQPKEIVRLNDLTQLILDPKLSCDDEISYKLLNQTQAGLVKCTEDGHVQTKIVTEDQWLGIHEIGFQVFLNDLDPSGLYAQTLDFTIQVLVENLDVDAIQQQFVVENSSPSTSQSNIELSSQVKLDYSLGKITDDTLVFTAQLSDKESDPFIVTFGEVESFLRPIFKDDYITVTVDQKTARNGSFTIPITVTQTVKAQQKSELFTLEIIIEGITQFEKTIEQGQKVDQTNPIAFEISEITETGFVTIKFDDEIDPVALKDINIESLRVEIIATDQTYVSQLLFVWEAVKITSTQLQIQLKFEREAYVSQALTEKDTLQVEIMKSNLLISKSTGKKVRISSKSAKSIPFQMSQEEESVIAKMRQVASLLEGGTSTMIGSNLAMQLILGGSLAVMWGLINSIQIIAHFPLIVVNFPPNALIFYKILYSVANFAVLPEEYLQEWTSEKFGIEDDDEEKDTEAMKKISYQLQENGGYENSSFWENHFMAIAIFCCLAVSSIFLFLLQLCFTKCEKASRIIAQMKQKLLWNSFLRFGLEQTLVGSIAGLIQIYESSSFNNKKAGTETSIAYLNLTFIVLLAVITPIFLHRRKEQLREIQHEARFGALMLDMDVNRFSPKLFQSFFILRRVLLSVIIVCLKDLPWVQITITSLLSLIQLMYLLVSKPFIEPSMNRLEIYHEFNVLFNSYALFIFSQSLVLKPNPGYPKPYNSHIDWEQDSAIFISDFDAHYDIAWAIIALIAQFIAVNLSLLIMGFIRTIYWKIKKCCLKNTYEKKLKEQQNRIVLRNSLVKDQKPEAASNSQAIQPADDNQLIQQPAKIPLGVSSISNNSNNKTDYQQQFTQLIQTRFKQPKTIQQNNDSIEKMISQSPKLIPRISNNQQNDVILDIISEVSEKESEMSSVPLVSSKLQISSQSSHNDTSGQELINKIEKQIAEMKLMRGDKSAVEFQNPQLDINFPNQQDANNSTRKAQAQEQQKNIEDEADEILADLK